MTIKKKRHIDIDDIYLHDIPIKKEIYELFIFTIKKKLLFFMLCNRNQLLITEALMKLFPNIS